MKLLILKYFYTKFIHFNAKLLYNYLHFTKQNLNCAKNFFLSRLYKDFLIKYAMYGIAILDKSSALASNTFFVIVWVSQLINAGILFKDYLFDTKLK